MALGYQPIPFVLKEGPADVETKLTVRVTTKIGKNTYWKYIKVPLGYVLKPGESFIQPPPKTM